MTAAVSSFVLFSIGALIPLGPWFFSSGAVATSCSVALTAIASLSVGGWISRSSSTSVAHGALRQLTIVVVAAALTFGIGKLFGTAVA